MNKSDILEMRWWLQMDCPHKGVTMRRLTLLFSVVLLLGNVAVFQAETIHVPSGQPTIRAGILWAVDGDTVLVADGIYTGYGNRDIDFMGKAIVVMSETGPENCVIDCEGTLDNPHHGFHFRSREDANSVLQGFTITNGVYPYGGGIHCYESSPTIAGNIITGNLAFDSRYGGGGIYCPFSSPTIIGNTITGNSTVSVGGGIGFYKGSPIIAGNTITGNTAEANGGGIWSLRSVSTITVNTITGNSANDGGGIYCRHSSSDITGNTITGNTGNSADSEGGGIFCDNSSPTITGSILWGNSPEEIHVESGNPVVTYSDIEGGWSGEGNIDSDPLFVLPDKRDYRLLWGSPCIEAGHPDHLDPDGTRSDMGAHYFNQNDYLTLYVTPDMTEVTPGDQLGVTYTAINRWDSPESFWLLSQVLLSSGSSLNVLGPSQYTLPANHTAQVHITHPVPNITPRGVYEYLSAMGVPPSTLYDWDSFKFWVYD